MHAEKKLAPPESKAELQSRARQLAGCQLGDLAHRFCMPLSDSIRGKGKPGELLECALGASAGSKDVPDFPNLGVELKTIPVDQLGRVRESTFVCSINLKHAVTEEWEQSRVRRKLSKVLFIPIEAEPGLPMSNRHIGMPKLWCPTPEEAAMLRADWLLLTGLIAIGRIDTITAHLGDVLQVRPKAKNSHVRALSFGDDGECMQVVPRGFYLRARFTEHILWSID